MQRVNKAQTPAHQGDTCQSVYVADPRKDSQDIGYDIVDCSNICAREISPKYFIVCLKLESNSSEKPHIEVQSIVNCSD